MSNPVLARTLSRSLLRGLSVGAATALLIGLGGVSLGAPSHHDSEAPVSYGADHAELHDRDNRGYLSGNVEITQGEMTLRSARATVAYVTENGSQKIKRVDASGGVQITREDETARGDVAVYDFDRRIITMVGNVSLRRAGTDSMSGGRLIINLDSGQASVDGRGAGTSGSGATGSAPGGRVTGTFSVAKKKKS